MVGRSHARVGRRRPAVALLAGAFLGGTMFVGALLPVVVPAARADECPSPQTEDAAVATGQVVFVGTVTAVSNQSRWATVQVEERWTGAGGLPDRVAVHGGAEPGQTTPYDRTYDLARYLFVVNIAPDYFFDDACTGTIAWSSSLARLRPPAISPDPDVAGGIPPAKPVIDLPVTEIALFGSLGIAVVSYLLILRGRRRPPSWFR